MSSVRWLYRVLGRSMSLAAKNRRLRHARPRSGAALGVLACGCGHLAFAPASTLGRTAIRVPSLVVRPRCPPQIPAPPPASTSRRAGSSWLVRSHPAARSLAPGYARLASRQARSCFRFASAQAGSALRVAMRCSAGRRGFGRFASRSLPRITPSAARELLAPRRQCWRCGFGGEHPAPPLRAAARCTVSFKPSNLPLEATDAKKSASASPLLHHPTPPRPIAPG